MISEDEIRRITEHTTRGIDALRAIERDLTVEATHDELSVTLRLDSGRVVGDIDHLTVTPNAFYVTDYKTNDLSSQSIEDLADHYWPQLRSYACALYQHDPSREVVLTLVFTAEGEIRQERLDAEEVVALLTQYEKVLQTL